MQPISVTVGPLTASDNNGIAEAQIPVAAQNLTLNGALVVGGIAVLDTPRRVIITSAGDDSARTFTITGTTFSGQVVSDTIQGTNASVSTSNVDFKTVTQIAISGSSASTVIAGTGSSAGSRWVRLDSWANAETSIQCNASGTVNYTVQVTMDDPNDPINPVAVSAVTWLNTNDSDAVAAIGDVYTNFQFSPTYARVLLNSGTGSVTSTFAQFNVVNK
jgi:hypothetical protein